MRILAPVLLSCAMPIVALGQGQPAPASEVTWDVPEPLGSELKSLLPPPKPVEGVRRESQLRPWARDVRRRVPEIAAAEGYFSATVEVQFEGDRDHVHVVVVPGPRAKVTVVDFNYTGDIALEGERRTARRHALEAAFPMKEGLFFRSADWEEAKNRLREALMEEDYAAGELTKSEAEVDADNATVHLRLTLDSGPAFTLGELTVSGLVHYPQSLIHRVNDLHPGERYRLDRLLGLQRALQNGPWFASVVVDIDRDPQAHERTPVNVKVIERPRMEIGTAVGYGTDAGPRAEVALRYRNLFNRGLDLQSAIRADADRQLGYADVYFPQAIFGTWKGEIPVKDSAGVLAEHTDIQGLETRRFAVAAYRQFIFETVEIRAGLSFQAEQSSPQGGENKLSRALAPVLAVTWRHVDDMFDPKRGGVLTVQFAAGAKALASDQDFFKTYAQYQRWFPISPDDQLILRGELGRTYAASREGIPEDFLFRAGGSRSVRGYQYQSLGHKEGDAIVGGRYLATASAEYVHWLSPKWGGAAFFDVGDAGDSIQELNPNRSYGVGARYKTPAGPLALDIAYAQSDRKVRLSFSVTVAF